MAFLFRATLLLNWFVALAWIWRVLTWRRGLGRVPDLTKSAVGTPPSSLPRLSVIVPARNEAEGIAATLHSLLQSTGVELQILAVDDRSEDGTGAIMEEIAGGIRLGSAGLQGTVKTLRVFHVTELPPGWLGKTHAMALAARHATGEWLLFTDGDVLFAPEALGRALGFAISNAADHLVLMPTLVLESPGERMMLAFLQVMSIWAVRLWRVADKRAPRDAIGVGTFNLIRRQVYDSIGGWDALRMEVIEDLGLGIRVKRRGFLQRAVLGRDLVRIRWVRGALGLVRGLAKNLFAFFRFRPELLLGSLVLLALFTLFPLGALYAGPAAWPATAIMLFAVFLAYRRQAEYQPFSAWQMVFFPAAALLMLYTLVRSMAVVVSRGGIVWRGTFYALEELRKAASRQVREPA